LCLGIRQRRWSEVKTKKRGESERREEREERREK